MPSNVDWDPNLLEDSSVNYPFLYHHKGEGLVTTTENLEIRDARMTLVRIHGKPTSFITLTDMSLVIKRKDCDDVIKAEVSESMPKMNMTARKNVWELCPHKIPTKVSMSYSYKNINCGKMTTSMYVGAISVQYLLFVDRYSPCLVDVVELHCIFCFLILLALQG